MLFLSDLSRQESDKHTTSQQEFDLTEFRTGLGRDVSQTTNTRWRQINQMCRTRYRNAFGCARRVSNQQVSHFSVCPETKQRTRAAQSARKFQTRPRTAQSARILELQIEVDKIEFLAEFTKRALREETRRITPTGDV